MSNGANIGPKIVLEGEREYRQSISEVNKSMKVLQSELKAVSAEFDGNANSMEALRAKNEVLTKQEAEYQKKLQLLRGALSDASAKYGENSSQVQNWQIKLNEAYAELSKLDKELSENKKYLKEAESSTDQTSKSINEYGQQVKEAENKTISFGDVLKANLASDAIITGVKTLIGSMKSLGSATIDVVKDSAAYADNILTLSAQTGLATDTLQELKYMEELTDVSLQTVTGSMEKQIRSMANAQKGSEEYLSAYKKIKVEAIDPVTGALRDSDTVYWEVIDALGQMANETERDVMAMLLLGKSAQDLNPVIKIGSSGLAQWASEARKMGAVLDNETLNSLGKTDDELQRLQEQLEITERKIGITLAPAMTKAFETVTDKVDESDEKIANFAEGALENVINGFVWMIDNAELIASGLSGITAAMITKKAAEGITYAVQAYKTYTTATETATAAQTAFNMASKANLIGAVASVVIGLGTAIYTYAKSASDAAEETRKLNDETEKLIEKSREINNRVQDNIQSRKEEAESLEIEAGSVNKLVETLYTLADQEKKTNGEKEQMLSLVKQINEAIPELNLSIDEQTGLINKQRQEIEQLIETQLEYNKVQAAQADLSSIATEQYEQEKALQNFIDQRIEKEKELQKLQKAYSESSKRESFSNTGITNETAELSGKIQKLNRELKENAKDIKTAENNINDLGEEYKETLRYIGDHSAIDDASESLENFADKFKQALDAQTTDEIGTVEDRISKINDLYDDQSDNLEDRLENEEIAFKKSQDSRVESVKKASENELKELEKAHKKKLDLINDEYLEKMKLVDEERYKELKKVQDQIDSLNNQTEAENRIAELKEEAEKRAELQSKINTATTAEEKLKAQQELADFEEKLARKRLQTERGLQKDILEEQKETINDSFDAKIKSLEEEQKKEEQKINNEYENEKVAIQERLNLKLEEIEEKQRLEARAFQDKQDKIKEQLQKEKDLAITNAKEIYEEDLAQFKINNALKYNEVVANEEKIKKAIQGYALQHSVNPFDINNINFDFETLKGLRMGTTTSIVKSSGENLIDYDKLTDVMVEALKNLDLAVILDNKKIGKIIDTYMNNAIK